MDTRPLQMLSGAEIVDRGRNVSKCILPEIGTKEVAPNGSWLETKQIQTALEKRKSLVAAERIDKVGALSHAEWRDQLKLAEVTQQVGGHWQYMGHNVNGTFFLLPEEALYLIETNCLLLKHNQVTVSLQKAYSLLLDDNTKLTQYKVYASLSRVGYKVFRHNHLKPMTSVSMKTKTNHFLSENIDRMDSSDDGNVDVSPGLVESTTNTNNISCKETITKSIPIVVLPNDNITNGSKVLFGMPTYTALNESDMAIDLPLRSNDDNNSSKTPSDMPLPTDTDALNGSDRPIDVLQSPDSSKNGPKASLESVQELPLEPDISNKKSKTSDTAIEKAPSNGTNQSQKPSNDMPLQSVTETPIKSHITIDLPFPSDNNMAIDLPFQPLPTDNNTAINLPLQPIPTDNNMAVDLPLQPIPTDNNMAVDLPLQPIPTDNNMAVDLPVQPIPTDNNLAVDLPLQPIPTDKNMAVDLPLQAIPTDNNMAIDLPLQSLPSDNNMAVDLPLAPDTSSNLSKTSDGSLGSNMGFTTNIPLPINVPKTNENDSQNIENVGTTEFLSIDSKVVLSIDELGVIRLVSEETADIEMNTVSSSTKKDNDKSKSIDSNPGQIINVYQITKQKIKNRKILPSNPKSIQEKFKDVPDCCNKQVVTVKVPSEQFLPRNVYLNQTSYELDLKNLKNIKNNKRPKSNPSIENRAMYKTIRNSSESESAAVPTPEVPQYIPSTPLYQQPFGYFPTWRPNFPRQHFNQHPYFYRMMHFMPSNFSPRPRPPYDRNQYPQNNIRNQYPRHQYPQNQNFRNHYPYNQMNFRNQYPHNQNNIGNLYQEQKLHNIKEEHLEAIKNLAYKLKRLPTLPNNSLDSLMGLIARFNEIYHEKIRITRNLNVVDDYQGNIETIELHDDEVQSTRSSKENSKFDKYLESVKTLAARLQNMERKNQSVAKQKRALQNLLKHFNETFNADFYLDSKGELKDNKLVVLDSSSDSDVVATDDITPTNRKRKFNGDNNDTSKNKKRKLVNPFSILKKVNEGASTSRSDENREPDTAVENSSTDLLKYFDKAWLPGHDDFGKALCCSKSATQHLFRDSQHLYDFIDDSDAFETWIDLKLSFCEHMEAVSDFEQDLTEHSRDLTTDESSLKSILVQEPNENWPTSLEKLRIIQTATDVQETSMTIDFDVYNRDVQNFRKTDPPKPHFRIVCVDECSKFPSGAEVAALHARCDDNVNIVFAVVGIGSISYLQMNPKDLPVYDGND